MIFFKFKYNNFEGDTGRILRYAYLGFVSSTWTLPSRNVNGFILILFFFICMWDSKNPTCK